MHGPPPPARPVALITGGTTGIGFATARLLHEQNYAVAVAKPMQSVQAVEEASFDDDFAINVKG